MSSGGKGEDYEPMEVRQAGVGETPRTRYAEARDGAHLVYQVFGDGVIPLVMTQGQASHLEHQWDFPVQTQFLRRLGQLARAGGVRPARLRRLRPEPRSRRRLGRGSCGRSRSRSLDAAQLDRAALYGEFHSGPVCIRRLGGGASRPHRRPPAHGFVLGVGCGHRTIPPGCPRRPRRGCSMLRPDPWGTGRTIEFFAPVLAADDRQRELFGQYERMATSPGEVCDLMTRWVRQDVRHLLPLLSVPTLILHQREDPMVRVEHSRYLADQIPDARYQEFPGKDHLLVGESIDEPVAVMSEFLTGSRESVRVDRVLATVLFFDIVGSTERLASVGDQAWRAVLDDFRHMVRREIDRFDGREIDTLGDDFFGSLREPERSDRRGAFGSGPRPQSRDRAAVRDPSARSSNRRTMSRGERPHRCPDPRSGHARADPRVGHRRRRGGRFSISLP